MFYNAEIFLNSRMMRIKNEIGDEDMLKKLTTLFILVAVLGMLFPGSAFALNSPTGTIDQTTIQVEYRIDGELIPAFQYIDVQNIWVEFPPHNAAYTKNLNRVRLLKIFDHAQGIWHDVTFVVKTDNSINEMMEMNMQIWSTEGMPGSITVNMAKQIKKNKKLVLSFELQELTLNNYKFLEKEDEPGVTYCVFNVSPNLVTLSAFVNEKQIIEEKEIYNGDTN